MISHTWNSRSMSIIFVLITRQHNNLCKGIHLLFRTALNHYTLGVCVYFFFYFFFLMKPVPRVPNNYGIAP